MSLYTIKYAPKNISQVFGQQMAVTQLKEFIVNYKQQRMKAVVLVGPIGVGKTASVYALAKELNYEVLEINSSNLRNQESIKTFLGAALGQRSLFFTQKMVLIDEVDNISGVKDRGCVPALIKAIEKSVYPVILTGNDIEDSKFKVLRKTCKVIDYHKLEYRSIAHCLQWICEQENLMFDDKALNSLARQADGDMRAALMDLHVCGVSGKITFEDVTNLSDRKRVASIITALRVIFKSSAAENALHALDDIDVDMEQVMFWMDNNLPKEYRSFNALARAYEHLARADVFKGRIRRQQHWRFLVYISNLLTAGISSAKDEKNIEFIQYKPTMRFLRMWQAKMKWAKKKEMALKLAAHTHTSTKVAMREMAFMQVIGKGNKEFAEELDLSAEEEEWLRR
jgi:replication factor C large subunit